MLVSGNSNIANFSKIDIKKFFNGILFPPKIKKLPLMIRGDEVAKKWQKHLTERLSTKKT